MALLFIEGFDHFTSDTHMTNKGWTFNGSFVDVGSGYRRYVGNGVRSIQSDFGAFKKNTGVDKSTIYFGAAIKKYGAGTPAYNSGDQPLVLFEDGSFVDQVKIHVGSSYELLAYDGTNSLLGTSANTVVPDQKWFYLEGKITISATVGEVTLRVNGTQVLNLTSQDTKNGSDYIRNIGFCAIHNDLHTYFDDIYVDDAQFHGDCQVKVFLPDSISTTNNSFTASAGNKDECVDDNPPTDDTDYISSSTLNHKQGFGITTGSLATVIGIQLNNLCRDDAAGSRKITPLIRSNGSDYSGTETGVITATYVFESEIFEDDPDDSAVWTQTKLEAAEFGLEITT